MKTIFITLLIVFSCFTMQAQVFPVENILVNGAVDNHINLVLIGDGYTAAEEGLFISDAQAFTTGIFNQTPFKEYKNFFNVYAIKVASNESGADHPGTATDVTEPYHPIQMVDTYFDSTFDSYNVHRLLTCNNLLVSQVVFANIPSYDQIVVLTNSPHYGGSGGAIAIGTTHSSGSEIALHEIGHSFSELKDEYWAGDYYAEEGINLTQNNDPTTVKWSNWMGVNGIGTHQHCCGDTSGTWYKPHTTCKMEVLGNAFCSVCSDGIIEKIHDYVATIESFLPDNSITLEPDTYPIPFNLNVIYPMPNTLAISWHLNATTIAGNTDSLQLDENDFVMGSNTLTATVIDDSNLQAINDHTTIHVNTVTWTIDNNTLGIDLVAAFSATTTLKLYPNPASKAITISLETPQDESVALAIYALEGRLINKTNFTSNTAFVFPVNTLSSGTYVFTLTTENGTRIDKRVVID
ncbi:T9SS type A sorting domain-containing protein [Bizionia gelidisalsuginis]|uniref:T9SS type A sorting domain-containing protein n=1 Tax=Bizionia gelidisalsuginis TaxID=291188 RepID=A0ABY3MBI4_9FLAO|nr:M64 family metallopeptidase [Bizionia gelidisalsuginis]TYC14159.1 T9SS type A sorting domain-containing protein [Bizionia gelidisalsuginis]